MNVTGTLTPDATCNYVQAGEYNGRDYARRLDGAYFIWWDAAGLWVISPELGVSGVLFWTREFPSIEGEYQPIFGTEGIATVTAGEH